MAAVLMLLLALTACSGDQGEDEPGSGRTTDADCADRIPDAVFGTLGWSPPKAAEATVSGCHRESEEGYVEVRDRTGDYDRLCRTLNRSGGVAPGRPAPWLGDVTACAVEPAGDVGQTKVLVKRSGDRVTQVTVTVVSGTDRDKIRAAVAQLLA
ncbi:MAG TPA: hypothetical protein VFV89_01820 [Nocardioides sp.]|uniref:hypothetical protein n=1 Tax=Nocardioides sp. TaxID=35761 RepID=UPI002E33D7C1|nr:hypothetical protein [Nocardioides sp.]HEX5086512.1 hypothetical protein [Nocardioides sp.]